MKAFLIGSELFLLTMDLFFFEFLHFILDLSLDAQMMVELVLLQLSGAIK